MNTVNDYEYLLNKDLKRLPNVCKQHFLHSLCACILLVVFKVPQSWRTHLNVLINFLFLLGKTLEKCVTELLSSELADDCLEAAGQMHEPCFTRTMFSTLILHKWDLA